MLEAYHLIAEERIKAALAEGYFDNIEGKGKPLCLEDSNPMIPDDSKIAFSILKNAGYIPQELALKKDIVSLEEAIAKEKDASHKIRQIKKLQFLRTKMCETGLGRALDDTSPYYSKLVEVISVESS